MWFVIIFIFNVDIHNFTLLAWMSFIAIMKHFSAKYSSIDAQEDAISQSVP